MASGETAGIKAAVATMDVRTLVAKHLGVGVGRVTDRTHLTNDLGADWLDGQVGEIGPGPGGPLGRSHRFEIVLGTS